MSDLVAWLREQIDADEHGGYDYPDHVSGCRSWAFSALMGLEASALDPDRCDCHVRSHLLDVQAKRAILDLCEAALAVREPLDRYQVGQSRMADRMVRIMAEVFADRPGYDETWRPA